ncbi:MAG: hypothetical protein IPH03_11465 [Tetrasphaera sp.]|nr:hypothetical protein [Tetrasphaera sp.]
MQLTGDRFRRRDRRGSANDLPAELPAEIRPRALPGVSSFQLHSPTTAMLTPGDAPDVLLAMNPRRPQDDLADLPAGRHPHRRHRRGSPPTNLAKVGYAASPHRRLSTVGTSIRSR